MLGTPEEVNSIIQTIEREAPAWGLFLNRTKCSIFRITDAPAAVVPNANFPHNVNIHTDGMTVMNLPVVGNSEFFRDSINELIDKHAGKIETIAQLDDVQMEYHALTMCLSKWSTTYCAPFHAKAPKSRSTASTPPFGEKFEG